MSLARRLAQEAIDIVTNDVEMSDELPYVIHRMDEEPFGDLHMDTQLEEANHLIRQTAVYHDLLVDFPVGALLTPSEERLFNAAVSMSLAGTGLKAEDLKVTVASTEGAVISQEGVGTAVKSVLSAIGHAIAAVLRKIREFFVWVTHRKTAEEKEYERILAALNNLPPSFESDLDKAIAESQKDIEAMLQNMGYNTKKVRDVAPGAVLEGEFLVMHSKSPNNPAGTTTKVNVAKMINLPWERINRLFEAPPSDHRVALAPLSEHLHQLINRVGESLPEVLSQLGKLDREIDQHLKSQQTRPNIMISVMRDLAGKMRAVHEEVKRAYHFEPNHSHGGMLMTLPVLPSGVALRLETNDTAIHVSAPWAQDFVGDSMPFVLGVHVPEQKSVQETFSIHVGDPHQVANAIDKCMKAYFHAFHRVEEISDELKLLLKARSLDENSFTQAAEFATTMLKEMHLEKDGDRTPFYFQRDLLGLKFTVVSSYAACYAILSHTTSMLAQYKHLYNWLQK